MALWQRVFYPYIAKQWVYWSWLFALQSIVASLYLDEVASSAYEQIPPDSPKKSCGLQRTVGSKRRGALGAVQRADPILLSGADLIKRSNTFLGHILFAYYEVYNLF